MSFLTPLFLIALSALGLPLIIHLLNLRRPNRIKFSTLAFFKELQKTTIRKIRIKRYLLLFVRLVAIACLAVVLARPFLSPGFGTGSDSKAPSLNAILIDNSISMSRIGKNGPLFEQAKQVVNTIRKSSKESDRFILQVTNGAEDFYTIVGQNQLLKRVEELEITPSGNYAGQRLQSLFTIFNDTPYENKRLFIISDGQASQFKNIEIDKENLQTMAATFVSLGNVEVQNSKIESFESSTNMIGLGLPTRFTTTIKNDGDVPINNQFISLEFDGELVGQYSLSMDANSSKTFEFEVIPLKQGSTNGKLIIEGDEFNLDNEYYFALQVPDSRRVLWVNENKNPALQSYTKILLDVASNNDTQLSYTKSGSEILGTQEINQYDAIILDGLKTIPEFAFTNLLNAVQGGKGIVFFPSEEGDIRNYNEFLQLFNVGNFSGVAGEFASFKPIAKGEEILGDHPIFAGLFDAEGSEELRIANPDIYYYLKLQPSAASGGFNILTMNTNAPLFREKRFGEGKLLISSIGNDPGWSNFSVRPLYAPFYYRSLLYAASSSEGGFSNHFLGNIFEWNGEVDPRETFIEVDGESILPDSRITTAGTKISYPAQDWKPGWVSIKDERKEYSVSVNLGYEESEFTQFGDTQVLNSFTRVKTENLDAEAIDDQIKASGFGREIWSWFVLAGLFFLVLESLISIFYKAENVH